MVHALASLIMSCNNELAIQVRQRYGEWQSARVFNNLAGANCHSRRSVVRPRASIVNLSSAHQSLRKRMA
jgi:hypothetical protein